MTPQEAREITKPGICIPVNEIPKSEPNYERFFIAKGYLESDAQWRERVRTLVEALEMQREVHNYLFGKHIKENCAGCLRNKALSQFRKEEK